MPRGSRSLIHDSRKYLWDARNGVDTVLRYIDGKTLAEYEADGFLRDAVERRLLIIGEAIAQLARHDAALAERIPDYRNIIAFRNILVHGYAAIDNTLVWRILQNRMTNLRAALDDLPGGA